MRPIPFNRPFLVGTELTNIAQAHANGQLAGDGPFTKRCSEWLEQHTGCPKALLTHSCTAALEIAAILGDVEPGDEVIIPSYTFVSTANAFVLRGGVPVCVDIRPDTLNIDESRIEQAITSKTKAIVPVHYAGVSCEMDAILDIAKRHRLLVIEDAAQGVMSSYKGRPLGAIGDLGCYSFHETKNIISGEGGALLVNNPEFIERAEIIREKGTNRSRFFRGQVDKYTWVDLGSSYLPGEIIAAFLAAQLDSAQEITDLRMAVWNNYHEAFADLESSGRVRRPVIPPECQHNAHMYYLLLEHLEDRTAFIESMKQSQIGCVFHYVPLHSAPYGLRHARACGDLTVTDNLSERLVRLPLWAGLTSEMQSRVIAHVFTACQSNKRGGELLPG
jgi:dTDP-4-amino-4,6-dideoxygalactose transaminase